VSVSKAPSCGKPMIRYETANGPMLEEPECAQPAGHNGACRSAPALRRKREADLACVGAPLPARSQPA
jgi:hypothetical protein